MKRWVVTLFLAIIALNGCGIVKKGQIVEVVRDSVRVEVREKIVIDTISVPLPVEVVRVVTLDTLSTLSTSLATSTAVVRGGVLEHSIENVSDSPLVAPVEVRWVEVVRDSVRVVQERVPVPVPAELTLWEQIKLRSWWVLALVVLLGVGLQIGKNWLSL